MAQRGSGTIQQRVSKLSSRLNQDQIRVANDLAASTDHSILKLANYLAAQNKGKLSAPKTEESNVKV
jgi:hypothetical protein